MKIILMDESDIAIDGTKGQIVIPQTIRKKLGIKPKTKLAIYSKSGKFVATKLEVPTVGEELKALFREIDDHTKVRRNLLRE